MKLETVNLFALAALLLASPAEPSRTDTLATRQRAYPQLWDVSERARNVPPEFGAWAFLRLANTPALKDKLWRRELIEEAFELAHRSSAPMRVRSTAFEGIGTRAMLTSAAHNSRLNRLSLQAEAVQAMAALDKPRANELFDSIAHPAPRTNTCSDGLWEDPAEYYETLLSLRTGSRLTDEQAQSLNAVVSRIRSPAELAPAARLIAGVAASANQRELLVSTLAAAITRIEPDDRGFVSTIAETSRDLHRLLDSASGGSAGMGLASAYRGYLVRHLRGSRCADTSSEGENNALQRLNALGVVPAIAAEDRVPVRREGRVLSEKILSGSNQQFNALMIREGRALSDEQKRSVEWQRQLADHLSELDVIQRDTQASEALRFYRVTAHLGLAVLAAPAGEIRDRLLLQYLGYLRSSPFQQESFIEWLGALESLATSVQSLHGSDYAKFERALIDSGHPSLLLYARLKSLR